MVVSSRGQRFKPTPAAANLYHYQIIIKYRFFEITWKKLLGVLDMTQEPENEDSALIIDHEPLALT